jgi:hypothetical protein
VTNQTPITPQQPATAPVPAQDAPGGPGRQPDAPETPLAALQRLQRLRGQLAAEHAKAVRADQQPRPDLDHLRVTPHNGIAAGLETAIFFVEHHLREVGEEARITPDNPATSSDTADNSLRERLAAAVESEIYEYRERTMFWEETGGVTEEIARLATRGAMTTLEAALDIGDAEAILDEPAAAAATQATDEPGLYEKVAGMFSGPLPPPADVPPAVALTCSLAQLRQTHDPHAWQPQPGMRHVQCPGFAHVPAGTEETKSQEQP